jgi:putative flippase GtrA
MSVILMTVEVELFKLAPMPARILTTGIMLFANYLMHKFMTFNPRLYRGLGRGNSSSANLPAEEDQ